MKNMPYDICVVATGGINNTRGISGSAKFAMPVKTVEDCHNIGQRLKELNRSNGRASVVVVGGGLEGIEALGEILRRYRRNPKLRIHIVEKNERLLATAPPGLGRDIKKICASFNVRFHMATRITRVAGNKVWLSSGESLESDATIWTGGVVPSPLLRKSGLTEQPQKWVPVSGTLQNKLNSFRRRQCNHSHFNLGLPFHCSQPPQIAFVCVGIPFKSRTHLFQ
jgi:NADH dehydrogenase